MVRRGFIRVVLAIAVSVAAAGCSSAGSSPGAGAGPTPGRPSSSPAASSTAAGFAAATSAASPGTPAVLTGSQLAAALLTPAQFPAGFTLNPSGTLYSGGAITAAAPKHDPRHLACLDLLTALWRPGFGEAAMATNSIVTASSGGDYSEAVYRFAGESAAEVFYQGLETTWTGCHTITGTLAPGVSADLAVTPVTAPAGLGTQDFAVDMSGTERSYIRLAVTVVHEGVDVFLSSIARLATAAPPGLDSATLLRELMAAVDKLG